jgi:dienelactone hydrolase
MKFLLQLLLATAAFGIDQWVTHPVDDHTFQTYLDFFKYDRDLALDLRLMDAEERDGVKREHLSFQSTPGARVFAQLYSPTTTSGKRPAIVFLHGGVPEGKDSLKLAGPRFARAGWNVLVIDLLYFGERSTDVLMTFTEPEKHERLYNQPSMYLAWVTQTVKDVSRSLDLLIDQRGADPKHLVLIGVSRGAIVGTIAGAVDRRFSGVVLLLGTHFDALEREHLAAACPANYIGRISPRPLLTVNGNLDTDHVKDKEVLPLLRLAKPPKVSLWQDTGHTKLTDENQAAMMQWLQDTLK